MTNHADELRSLITAYVTEQCTVLLDAETALRTRDDVIHPTRVALRRLRSTLRVFAEVFDIARAGQLEDELVWWAGLLGAVRDLDILGARLEAAVNALAPELVLGPVRAQLQTEVSVRRHTALDAVVETLDSERYRALATALQEWRTETPYVGGSDTGPARVGFYVKRAEQKVSRRLAAAVAAERASTPAAGELLHRARKSGKRHRYALELAEPALGEKATRAIAVRRELQDVLGDRQDSIVTAEFLREVGAQDGSVPGHNGFTYGLLYARELESGRDLLTRLQPLLG